MNPLPGLDAPIWAQPLDPATIDAVLAQLFAAEPPPHVMAINDIGLWMPLPPEVPVAPGHAIGAVASALALCVPDELGLIVDAWQRARERGGAQTLIHLRDDPRRAVTLHLVDARHRFGAFLGILVGPCGPIGPDVSPSALFRPRSCSMKRDEVAVFRGVDAAITRILGWTADELIGTRSSELLHPDDRPLAIAHWMEMLARPGSDQRVVARYRNRDGKYIWFENTHRNLLNDPAHGYVVTEMVDVSERMEAIEALRASELLLRRLTETLPLGIAQIAPSGSIVYRNERLLEIAGVAEAATVDALFIRVTHADYLLLERTLAAVLRGSEVADIELRLDNRDGQRRCSVGMRALDDGNATVTGAIVTLTDSTERVRLREELEQRATFDTLTACRNRTSILEALDALLHRRTGSAAGIAVLFVDLDRFKEINDRLGHAAGDELLRLTGQRLLASVRSGELVGRLGGDEFLVVCPDVASPETALEIGHRISAALAACVELGTTRIEPRSSVGVAWTAGSIDCDALVATADEAMYASKRAACGPVLALR